MTPRVEQYPYLQRTAQAGPLDVLPCLPLHLSHQGRAVAVTALLDTGSTVDVLPYDVGLQLGLIWGQSAIPARLTGNLATIPAYGVAVHATVGQFQPVLLAFAWVQTDTIPVILGQMNFFQEFDVCFFRSRAVFEIRKAPANIQP